MIEQRVKYGIDNFLKEDFFLPSSDLYCLEEKSETGRSELQLYVQGDNLCSEDYDHKGKCNFLRIEKTLKLGKSVDHILLQKKDKWILHLIEMKSQVDNKRWYEIKQKVRASYFNVCALEKVLGIHIEDVRTYTTYERTAFWKPEKSENPKAMVPLLGKPMPLAPKDEWESNMISVNIGEVVKFQHKSVKMQRTEKGDKLVGELSIY